jgi:hypothetical protein
MLNIACAQTLGVERENFVFSPRQAYLALFYPLGLEAAFTIPRRFNFQLAKSPLTVLRDLPLRVLPYVHPGFQAAIHLALQYR